MTRQRLRVRYCAYGESSRRGRRDAGARMRPTGHADGQLADWNGRGRPDRRRRPGLADPRDRAAVDGEPDLVLLPPLWLRRDDLRRLVNRGSVRPLGWRG